jgi:hypothetical protein
LAGLFESAPALEIAAISAPLPQNVMAALRDIDVVKEGYLTVSQHAARRI